MTNDQRRVRARLAAVLLGLTLAGCGPTAPVDRGKPMLVPPPEAATTFTSTTSTAGPGWAVDVLAQLPVKGRAPKTGYSRAQFGPAWADVDHNGCDTRDDILARDMPDETFKPGTHNCVVLTGTVHDPYTGKTIPFTRGRGTSTRVQIDHRVALSDAWQTGAQALSPGERESLANDPVNLVAVDGPTNEAKGDGDAATWLPPVISYRCRYVEAQITVKAKYHLWVTPAEHDAMAGVLAGGCDE